MTQAYKVADDMVVSLVFVLRDGDGELLDRADASDPLEFVQGHDQIISGLEEELYGMALGDEKDIVIVPEDAYGDYDPEAIQRFPIDEFPPEVDLEIGAEVELQDADSGEIIEAYVAEIDGDSVVLDFNHPLAGEELHFHVKVVGLRWATEEELEHGHVHGSNNHH